MKPLKGFYYKAYYIRKGRTSVVQCTLQFSGAVHPTISPLQRRVKKLFEGRFTIFKALSQKRTLSKKYVYSFILLFFYSLLRMFFIWYFVCFLFSLFFYLKLVFKSIWTINPQIRSLKLYQLSYKHEFI